jgi:hypothetical protein
MRCLTCRQPLGAGISNHLRLARAGYGVDFNAARSAVYCSGVEC